MRLRLMLAAAVSLAACSQPAPKAETPPAPPPVETACNTIAPDIARPVRVQAEAVGAASVTPELRGGPISPGTYDLTSGAALDGAPGWAEDHFVALDVRESETGVVFNYADAAAGAETTRWSARFHEGPPAQLEFSCGREGAAEVAFAAEADRLQLRMPDPRGSGALLLVFARRG